MIIVYKLPSLKYFVIATRKVSFFLDGLLVAQPLDDPNISPGGGEAYISVHADSTHFGEV